MHAWICNDCHNFVKQTDALVAEVAIMFEHGNVPRLEQPECSRCKSTDVQDNRGYTIWIDDLGAIHITKGR